DSGASPAAWLHAIGSRCCRVHAPLGKQRRGSRGKRVWLRRFAERSSPYSSSINPVWPLLERAEEDGRGHRSLGGGIHPHRRETQEKVPWLRPSPPKGKERWRTCATLKKNLVCSSRHSHHPTGLRNHLIVLGRISRCSSVCSPLIPLCDKVIATSLVSFEI
ncbi:hypothetical protein BJ165DRAFT_1598997, partial [Panaeolus papilionaceus]